MKKKYFRFGADLAIQYFIFYCVGRPDIIFFCLCHAYLKVNFRAGPYSKTHKFVHQHIKDSIYFKSFKGFKGYVINMPHHTNDPPCLHHSFKVPKASSSGKRHHVYQGFKTISRVFCIISWVFNIFSKVVASMTSRPCWHQ